MNKNVFSDKLLHVLIIKLKKQNKKTREVFYIFTTNLIKSSKPLCRLMISFKPIQFFAMTFSLIIAVCFRQS